MSASPNHAKTAILPHQGPMRWIDRITTSPDGREASATIHISQNHPVVRDGILLRSALIEFMAQTAAAGSAVTASHSGRRIRQGVLAAIANFTVSRDIPVESDIEIRAAHDKSFGPFSQVQLEVRLGGQPVAQARMTFHLTFE